MDISLTLAIAQVLFTLIAGVYAIFLFQKANKEKRDRFILEIYDRFYGDHEIREVLYYVDRNENVGKIGFRMDLERQADKTIKFLDFIDHQLKQNQIRTRDVKSFIYEFDRILKNVEVFEYRKWLHKENVILDYLEHLELVIEDLKRKRKKIPLPGGLPR